MPLAQDWWLQSGTTSTDEGPALMGQSGQVKSEMLSDNPLTRSIALPFVGRTASSSAGYSSDYVLWRPFVPLTIQRVQLVTGAQTALTTDTDFVLFRNSSSCVAGVTITSTTVEGGTRTAVTLVNAAIAACTDVTLKFAYSTCAEPSQPRGHVQIDYQTAG